MLLNKALVFDGTCHESINVMAVIKQKFTEANGGLPVVLMTGGPMHKVQVNLHECKGHVLHLTPVTGEKRFPKLLNHESHALEIYGSDNTKLMITGKLKKKDTMYDFEMYEFQNTIVPNSEEVSAITEFLKEPA